MTKTCAVSTAAPSLRRRQTHDSWSCSISTCTWILDHIASYCAACSQTIACN